MSEGCFFFYQCVLIAVVNHPSFLDSCAGSPSCLPHRLNHPHQRDVNTGKKKRIHMLKKVKHVLEKMLICTFQINLLSELEPGV